MPEVSPASPKEPRKKILIWLGTLVAYTVPSKVVFYLVVYLFNFVLGVQVNDQKATASFAHRTAFDSGHKCLKVEFSDNNQTILIRLDDNFTVY